MNPSKPETYSAAPETGGNGNRQPSGGSRGRAATSHEAASRVKDVALTRVEEVGQAADTAKHRAAERVRAFGSAIRSVANHLRGSDERMMAKIAERASERIDGFADFVETAEPSRLVRQGEDLARRNPIAFIAGTFLIGLTLGRLLRSATHLGSNDSSESHEQTSDGRSYGGGMQS